MSYMIPAKIQQLGKDIQEDELRYHYKEVRVSKEFTFDSAHHLHCYEGKCQSLHGHTYKLRVVVCGQTDERGIVIDFADLKKVVEKVVLEPLDHRYLNEVLPRMNTTAENMAVWMFEQLRDALREEGWHPRVRLEIVRLWETPTSFAEVTNSMMGSV